MNTAPELIKKYNLTQNPTEQKIIEWAQETQKLISLGVPSEQAGEKAADKYFSRGNFFTCSQAQTVSALLSIILEK